MTAEIEARILDAGSFTPVDDGIESRDPLAFPGYASALERVGEREAISCGPATIDGHTVEVGLFDFGVMGGSMGEAVGERLARGLERAAERGAPFVLYTATGGARMQEGMRALVQMPKLVVARASLAAAYAPLIVVLGNPTTGGVLASIASLGDITIAERGATVGFAGPRVAQQVLGRPLSGETHTADFAAGAGLVDAVVSEQEVRAVVARALAVLAPDESPVVEVYDTVKAPATLDAWDVVTSARSDTRARAPEIVTGAADSLIELRGDRSGSDDPAVFAALVRITGRRVVLIALDRMHLPGPGAYRKARRAVGVAVRLNIPIVTLVDTRGADPSEDSEREGIAGEVAALFDAILAAPVPVISLITGEGGSGGALAFGCGDRLIGYEGAFFSVIAPEAAAQILWRDGGRGPDAARALGITAQELLRLGIVDEVVPEPLDAVSVKRVIAYSLRRSQDEGLSGDDLVSRRRARWRTRNGY